jgi:hypothetical protein
MNDNLYNKITITIVLYKEKLDLVFSCLESIKNFKIIIVDNAGSVYLKKNRRKISNS